MSVMGLQKSLDRVWVGEVSSIQLFFTIRISDIVVVLYLLILLSVWTGLHRHVSALAVKPVHI